MNKIVPLTIASILSANTYAKSIGYEELKGQLFGTINNISTCSVSTSKNEIVEYRLIKAYIYGSDMIFLDKIKMSQHGLTVIAGYTFKEINDTHIELSLKEIKCRATENNRVIITGAVDGTGHDENKKYQFSIILDTSTGEYKYKQF